MKVTHCNIKNKFRHQNLTDKGWAQMQQVLDKEMPVKKPRRRPLGWVLLALLFVLAPMSRWIKSTITNTETLEVDPFGVRPNAGDLALKTAINGEKSIDQQIEAVVDQQKAVSKAALYNTFYTELNTAQAQNISIPSSIEGPSNTPPSLGITSRLPHATACSVNTLAVKAHLTGIEDQPHPIITKHKKTRHSILQFGITAGAVFGQVRMVPGMTAGFNLDYRPRFAPRWGMRTGIAYRYQQLSGEGRPIIPVSFDQYYRATYNVDILPDSISSTWVDDTKRNRILVPVSKVHRLDIPLSVFWESKQHFRFFAGANFSRAVWIQSGDRSLFTYNLNVLNSPSEKATAELNSVVTNILPAWDINWQTGMSYRIGRHIEIGLMYRQNWMNREPIIEEARDAYSNCLTCLATFPSARQRTLRSIQPKSWLVSASYKF